MMELSEEPRELESEQISGSASREIDCPHCHQRLYMSVSVGGIIMPALEEPEASGQ